jgi:hypothetical protein
MDCGDIGLEHLLVPFMVTDLSLELWTNIDRYD